MKYVINDTTLTAIGDAVREKGGTTELIPVTGLADAITNLPSGGGGGDLPEEAFNITGDCNYRFASDGWNWFIETYGNKVKTNNISNLDSMCYLSKNLESIPFEINCTPGTTINLSSVFFRCEKLKAIPKINNCKVQEMDGIFNYCYQIKEFPEDMDTWFDWSYIDNLTSPYSGGVNKMFAECINLRKLPMAFLNHGNPNSAYSMSIYNNMCQNCRSLDEIVDLPNPHLKATWTSSAFNYYSFQACGRLKNFTFAMPDGQPYVVNWKSQNIDLSNYVGYSNTEIFWDNFIIFTPENRVTDAATYQALKDSSDWWTTDIAYSRYNHDSAVATLNSLPDTSAYLATAGGTNTIKFKGASGSATDGGAINTLTEEEIAVATVKGWTVTYV